MLIDSPDARLGPGVRLGRWPRGCPLGRRVILAGGLTPDNVAEAIAPGAARGASTCPPASSVEPGPQGRARKLHALRQRGQGRGRADGEELVDLDGPSSRRPAIDVDDVDDEPDAFYDWEDDRVDRPSSAAVPSDRSARGTAVDREPCMGEPTADGRFGEFGGRFVPETLDAGLPRARGRPSATAWADPAFRAELDDLLRDYAGRPSPLTECHRLSERARACGCCSSARTSTTPARTRSTTCSARPCWPSAWARPGWWPRPAPASTAWPRATAAALLGHGVHRLHGRGRHGAPGAQRVPHAAARRRGACRRSPAAARSRTRSTRPCATGWPRVETTHYCLGSVMGPHPYPWMVREFHRVIGDEARAQCAALLDGGVPDVVTACVGGGSNAIGIFSGFADTRAELVGVEPAGGAAIGRGVPGVVHGIAVVPACRTSSARCSRPQSISAGLDYPGVGPEHSHLAVDRPGPLRDGHRRRGDRRLRSCCRRTEGIIPALEPAHALAWVSRDRAALAGQDRAGQPVGPGRQGRGPDDGHPRRASEPSTVPDATLRRAARVAPARAAGRRAASCSCPT